VAYRLKHDGGRGETHRFMEPMEFMAGTATLVPPPRHPLVRYHGVFAPNSPWRGAVIPTAPPAARGCPASGETPRHAAGKEPPQAVPMGPAQRHPDGGDVFRVADGGVAAKSPRPTTRIDWATLLHRVWSVDARKCPRCEGPMKFLATIHDRVVIVRILAHLRLPTDEMLPAPARRWDDTS